jgi:hypothetical protein
MIMRKNNNLTLKNTDKIINEFNIDIERFIHDTKYTEVLKIGRLFSLTKILLIDIIRKQRQYIIELQNQPKHNDIDNTIIKIKDKKIKELENKIKYLNEQLEKHRYKNKQLYKTLIELQEPLGIIKQEINKLKSD